MQIRNRTINRGSVYHCFKNGNYGHYENHDKFLDLLSSQTECCKKLIVDFSGYKDGNESNVRKETSRDSAKT